MVGHLARHGLRDARLAFGVERLALGVGQVLGGGAGHPHAAVKTRHQPEVGQALDVAAHGLQGHAQGVGKFFHGGRTAQADLFEQQQLAGIGVHAGIGHEKEK